MSVKIKHINDDATYLITFSIPEDSNIPYPQLQDFTILTDPWIVGSWQLLHPKIVFSKPAGQCCIESLAQLESPPNIVVISQDKPDHCNEKSLKQLDSNLRTTTIYAHAGAAKRIKSWRYFPTDKIIPFSIYGIDDNETSLVRFSIPAAEELHKYPGIIPGELTMAFLAPKFDLAGVHNGIGFTYRPPMFVGEQMNGITPLLSLIPLSLHEDTAHEPTPPVQSRNDSILAKGQSKTEELTLRSSPSHATISPKLTRISSRRKRSESLTQLNLSPYQTNTSINTPPDSPSRSTTTIETQTTATEISIHEQQSVPPMKLDPSWILPPTPTLKQSSRPRATTAGSTSSSLHRLKSAISSPDLHMSLPKIPKKKKSLNLRAHRRNISADQPPTISTPHTYTTASDAPPLPKTPLSAFYPLTPSVTNSSCRPITPFTPTSTIAGPKTISILYVPHGIPYAALEPWVTSHLVSTAALPLNLLLHPFDSVRNLWFLGGEVISGGQHGVAIAKALMAKQWISTHDGAKEETGWLLKKVVKRAFSREEVGRILDGHDRDWDYRRHVDRQRPKTGVDVLKVGQEIDIWA